MYNVQVICLEAQKFFNITEYVPTIVWTKMCLIALDSYP